MDTVLKTIDQIESILDEISDAFFDIPFENSAYQTEQFVIAASITPERAYRSIGLRMSTKIQALQEAKFGRINQQINLDEIEWDNKNTQMNEFDVRRQDVRRQQAESEIKYTDKLINDAIVELNILYKHFRALPKFTREQFEAGEKQHFTERMNRDMLLNPSQQSLVNMNEDIKALLAFEKQTEAIDHISDESLKLLHNQLTNINGNQVGESLCTDTSVKSLS